MKKIAIGLSLFMVGIITGGVLFYLYFPKEEPQVIYERDELTGWELLQMAIIKTESNFDHLAIGTHNDLGIMQITSPYVKEVNKIIDTARFVHTDAFDVHKSLVMFGIYQEAKNPEHDIEKAIQLHNPNGNSIGYTEKVLENFRYLSRIEEIRKEVVR